MNGHRLAIAGGRAVLTLERVARLAWAPASLVLVFLAVAALDVLPRLPPWLHAAVLVAFTIAIAESLRRALIVHAPHGRDAALRRLEHDSGIAHRPFDALRDQPIGSGYVQAALWRLHQSRTLSHVRRIRLRGPRASLAAHDTRAWRALALIVFLLAVVLSPGRFPDKLDAALSPRIWGGGPGRDIALDIWITPPAYTGQQAVILHRDGSDGDVEIPQGSVVQARIGGGSARPHITVNGKRQKFQAIDRHDFEVSAILQGGNDISVTQGWRTLGRWRIAVADNVPPVIQWTKPPAATKQNDVSLDYTAADQYGLATLTARIELSPALRQTMLPAGTALDSPEGAVQVLALTDFDGHPKSMKNKVPEDLTASPWAGLPVSITLTATGVSGLSASTTTEDIVLPERKFRNPIARMIVELRKRLILDPTSNRIDVASKISELSGRPDLLNDDAVVFLALRIGSARLFKDSAFTQLRDMENLLWQSAIRLEDGRAATAKQDIADAARALRQALQNGAPQSEIARLTRTLQQAMDRYIAQMQQEMMDRLRRGETMLNTSADRMLKQSDLDDMLDRMQSMAGKGDRQGAEDMLSQMENIMRNLRMAGPSNATRQAWKTMNDMRGLADRQRALNERTGRSAGGRPDQADKSETQEQQDIQNGLADAQKRLQGLGADVPDSLKQSGQAMGNAEGQLSRKDYKGAMPSQSEALQKLRDGMQALGDQLSKAEEAEKGGAAGEDKDSTSQKGKDPFGREEGTGSADDGQVHVPEQGEQQRSREVLDELRKRSGERSRSKPEHEYIDRLLRDY